MCVCVCVCVYNLRSIPACVRSLRQSFAGKVTASSTLSSTYALKYSTLDSKGPSGNGGGWCPRTNNVAEFIQVISLLFWMVILLADGTTYQNSPTFWRNQRRNLVRNNVTT